MRRVVEVVPAVLLNEIVVLQPQDVAIAHCELQHHRGGEPSLAGQPSVPCLDALQHVRGRARIAWCLRPERGDVEMRDVPPRVFVVWHAPLGENAAQLAYVAPGGETREPALHERG